VSCFYVIGSGVSAYIAALSLADCGRRVVIVDDDDPPAKLEHSHLILAGGWRALLNIAPDLEQHVSAAAIVDATAGWNFRSVIGSLPRCRSGVFSPVISAKGLLSALKSVAAARGNITRLNQSPESIVAMMKARSSDFFVIASGFRGAITDLVMEDTNGVTRVEHGSKCQSLYSTFTYQIPKAVLPDWRVLVRDLRIDGTRGLLCTVSSDGIATISAVSSGEKPCPIRTPQELARFLRDLKCTKYLTFIGKSTLLDRPRWYRFTGGMHRVTNAENGWRKNIILFGDAFGYSDPYFGHGIFQAAMQGLALNKLLLRYPPYEALANFRIEQMALFTHGLSIQKMIQSPYSSDQVTWHRRMASKLLLRHSRALLTKLINKMHLILLYEKYLKQWSKDYEEEDYETGDSGTQNNVSNLERHRPEPGDRRVAIHF